MKTTHERRAIIVAAELIEAEAHTMNEQLNELEALLRALDIATAGRVMQKRRKFVAKSLLGEGKLTEIRDLAVAEGATMIVFDRELSPGQVRNLESFFGRAVYDRTSIILEIFHENARTPQAKTQVEIARLTYQLPRLTGAWTHFHRQKGGGVNSKGMGETQIEIDRRRTRDRIHRLQKELQNIRKDKRVQSKARQQELKVALVGYTNSGKTSLMNKLTRSGFSAKDQLFATLDANVRQIDPQTRPKILLSDTVGFIRNLPHSLVESFKSTLDHVLDADLLLHVADLSASSLHEQIATTEAVLQEIGASKIPSIIVFNKSDLVEDPFYGRIVKQKYPGSIVVSAFDEDRVTKLRKHIYGFFAEDMRRVLLFVPHDASEVLSLIHSQCLILDTDYSDEDGIKIYAQMNESLLAKLQAYVVKTPVVAFKRNFPFQPLLAEDLSV